MTSLQLDKLYKKDRLDTAERVVLDLASAIHFSRSSRSVVSWAAQQEAFAYFKAHGLDASIARVVELGGPSWLEPSTPPAPEP